MSRYFTERQIDSVGGDDTFCVEADSPEEAMEKFEAGEGVLVESGAEVMGYHPWDFGTLRCEDHEVPPGICPACGGCVELRVVGTNSDNTKTLRECQHCGFEFLEEK